MICIKRALTMRKVLVVQENRIFKFSVTAVIRFETRSQTTIDNLTKARRIYYKLQKKLLRPKKIYAHRWEEGDLVQAS